MLQSDGCTVTLTTSALGTSAHTLTVSNVKTLNLAALPTNFLTATFTYAAPGWAVTVYEANVALNDTIAMAQTLISTPSEQSWVKTEVVPYIDFNVTGGVLHFPSKEQTLPGTTMGTETDNFAVTATGTLVIPAAGTYTFGCDSDDGFSLTITGATFSSVTNATNASGTNSLQYNGGRGVADTLGVVTFSSAGDYPDQPPLVPRQRRLGVRAVRRPGQLHQLQLEHGIGGRHRRRRSQYGQQLYRAPFHRWSQCRCPPATPRPP